MDQKSDKKFAIMLNLFLILVTPFLVIMSSFNVIAFSDIFYEQEFEKNYVYSDVENADLISDSLVEYLKHGEYDDTMLQSFSEQELDHMYDVRKVITWFNIWFYITFILYLFLFIVSLIIFKKEFRKVYSKTLKYSGGFSIALICLMSILGFVFESFFSYFHSIFFEEGTWVFGWNDMLIRLYGGSFFFDSFVWILVLSFIFSCGLIGAGWVLGKDNIFTKQNN